METKPALQVLLDSNFPDARLPTKGSSGAAGYDIYSCEGFVISARTKKLVRLALTL